MLQPVGSVHPFRKMPNFGADVAARDGIGVRAVEGGELSVLHRRHEAAGIRAIKGTDGLDGMFSRKAVMHGSRLWALGSRGARPKAKFPEPLEPRAQSRVPE